MILNPLHHHHHLLLHHHHHKNYLPHHRKVEALEKDKVAQALEIIKLKQRVKKLERKNKVKVSGLRRLKKVGTAQRVESSADTVKDDASKQGGIIADIDAYEDVTLKDVAAVAHEVDVEKEVKFEENADDDKPEPAEIKEVVEVVTIDKLMTEVVTAAMATIIAIATVVPTITTAPSAARRRKGVVIRYPEETYTPATIIHFEPKFKDKGKGIMVQEPKPLKKQAHIKQDEAYARELEAELNKNINWDDVIEKNMMIYLKNMTGFKLDYFKGMSYDDIRPIFEKYFNSNVAFLEKTKEQLEEEESRALKRTSESLEEKAANKATPLSLKVPVVDYEIYSANNKPYYKIKRADGSHQLFLSFLSLLRNFDREDLKMILLVEKRYPLTRFSLEQMLNNVRLEVEEESEVSLELLRFVRQQQREGYILELCLDPSSIKIKIKTKIKLVKQEET
nr:hypothetical protein [Tanacetum cinerariifolium]